MKITVVNYYKHEEEKKKEDSIMKSDVKDADFIKRLWQRFQRHPTWKLRDFFLRLQMVTRCTSMLEPRQCVERNIIKHTMSFEQETRKWSLLRRKKTQIPTLRVMHELDQEEDSSTIRVMHDTYQEEAIESYEIFGSDVQLPAATDLSESESDDSVTEKEVPNTPPRGHRGVSDFALADLSDTPGRAEDYEDPDSMELDEYDQDDPNCDLTDNVFKVVYLVPRIGLDGGYQMVLPADKPINGNYPVQKFGFKEVDAWDDSLFSSCEKGSLQDFVDDFRYNLELSRIKLDRNLDSLQATDTATEFSPLFDAVLWIPNYLLRMSNLEGLGSLQDALAGMEKDVMLLVSKVSV